MNVENTGEWKRKTRREIRKECQVDSKLKPLSSSWYFVGNLWCSLISKCTVSISALFGAWHSPCVPLSSRGHLLIKTPVILEEVISKGRIVASQHPTK